MDESDDYKVPCLGFEDESRNSEKFTLGSGEGLVTIGSCTKAQGVGVMASL